MVTRVCAVDADEIRRLGKRFRKLDLDNSGALSIDEFMSLPELQQNPLVQRVIDIFDADGNGEVRVVLIICYCFFNIRANEYRRTLIIEFLSRYLQIFLYRKNVR